MRVGRPRVLKADRRTIKIMVRVNKEEHARLKWVSAGKKISSFLRVLGLNHTPERDNGK
jgi:hypothetical protein